MRLDLFLFCRGFARSRTEAKNFIAEGRVTVGGKTVTKPAYEVPADAEDVILCAPECRYVSRGGLKLEAALRAFSLRVEDALALDIGASRGGFTDCLLRYGARHVVAVDSGTLQLAESLRADTRVSAMENCNARYLSPGDLPYTPEICVMDVSFISATYIIPAVYRCLGELGDFVCLIKPQFEVGRAGLGKGGIVRDARLREQAVRRVTDFAVAQGFCLMGLIESPITGGDGNTEYLAHFRK